MLRYHLYILSQNITSKSNITQITIVKPDVEDSFGYYNISPYDKILEDRGIKIKYLDVQNKGDSYSQYLQCFNVYPDFDYYIIMEDDWTVNIKFLDFDKILLDLYRKTFTNDIGFLNCWSPNSGRFVGHLGGFNAIPFHSAITLGMLSKYTITKLLHNLSDYYRISQLDFSKELLQRNIPIVDLNQANLPTKVIFWETPTGLILDYSENDNANEAFFTPIQYYYDNITYQNKTTNMIYSVNNNFQIHKV